MRFSNSDLLQASAIACAAISAVIAFVQAVDPGLANLMQRIFESGGPDVYGSDFGTLVTMLNDQQKWALIAGVFALASVLMEAAALTAALRR